MADDTNTWVLTSERLPSENGRYLVTIDGFTGSRYVELRDFALDLFKVDKFDFSDRKGVSGWYVYDAEWGCYEIDDVVAWMPSPAPAPYKTKSEVEG